jgi:prophage tail gpP-like protein
LAFLQIGRGTDIGNAFEETTIEPDSTVLSYIIKLAKQRGLLVTNAINGDLLILESSKRNAGRIDYRIRSEIFKMRSEF